MTYKDAITEEMSWLGKQKDTIFIGEGLINADRIYGTLKGVPLKKCIEMPVAENLIVGCAIGLALRKYRPIVIFNFMDFMLVAADMIIHHLAAIPQLSGDKIRLPVIIRTIIGKQGKRFEMGCQHNNNFIHVFKPYIPCFKYVVTSYKDQYKRKSPAIIVERKDDYGK